VPGEERGAVFERAQASGRGAGQGFVHFHWMSAFSLRRSAFRRPPRRASWRWLRCPRA
jgi:hypothetical protein